MKGNGNGNGNSEMPPCAAASACAERFANLEDAAADARAAAEEDKAWKRSASLSLGHIERLVRALARKAHMDPDKE